MNIDIKIYKYGLNIVEELFFFKDDGENFFYFTFEYNIHLTLLLIFHDNFFLKK